MRGGQSFAGICVPGPCSCGRLLHPCPLKILLSSHSLNSVLQGTLILVICVPIIYNKKIKGEVLYDSAVLTFGF